MQGRRLPDRPIGGVREDTQPGDYWRVLTRTEPHRPLDMNRPEDRGYWRSDREDAAYFASNLTGEVWEVIDPLGHVGMLCLHTVREEEDGTISVRPGDGSSNSILIKRGDVQWHGYIEHGVWNEC